MKIHKMQRTIAINNPSELEKRLGNETLVICGSPRGMTSVVAYCLYELDYNLGTYLGAKNYEDQEFLHAIPPFEWLKKSIDKHEPFISLVHQRNKRFPRWGFKLPRASEHVLALTRALRNPIFVVCIRNPLAVARSVSNREPQFEGDLLKLINVGKSFLTATDVLLKEKHVPSILVDMDMVEQQPGLFLEEFTAVLKLEGDLTKIKTKLSTKGYKETAPKNGVSFKKQ